MKPPAQSSSCLHCRSAGSAHSAGSAVPLRLHAVSACASTPPLSGERGSAAATVTRLSRRAPSAVPPCPAQSTPPLDRSGEGSTPATIYPRARAQLLSCPWRCERARRCNRFARGARRCNRYARGAWRREGRGPACTRATRRKRPGLRAWTRRAASGLTRPRQMTANRLSSPRPASCASWPILYTSTVSVQSKKPCTL